MTPELAALLLTAGSLGLVHTLIGPDHYVPFIAMSRARRWSRRKTLLITFLCGLGHVLSSVVIGLAGIGLGIAVARLEGVESTRGEIAAWLMIAFGLAYGLWGLKRGLRGKSHRHAHGHPPGGHDHSHAHDHDHVHVHDAVSAVAPAGERKANITPWILFTIFVFGPCEPLIPILMYPAARMGAGSVVLVTAAFAVATIGTMLTVVGLGTAGLRIARFGGLERWMHATAGAMIFLCGFAIKFLGL
jgi:nickel/cobalt exporter